MGTLTRGLLAGLAGTAALNAASYLDMAVRGRPASTTPRDSAGRLTGPVRLPLGSGQRLANRLEGLGALLGYAVGAGVGAGYAALPTGRLRGPASALALGAAAMLAANVPMTALGITDPRRWSAADWLADAVPHLAYGAVAAAALDRMRPI